MTTGFTLYVVSGPDNQVDIDVERVVRAEARIAETEVVTNEKAPELLGFLNRSLGDLQRTEARLRLEKDKAEVAARRARSDALLTLTDEFVAARGFSKSSKEVREALIDKDPEVVRLEDRLTELAAQVSYANASGRKFYNAFSALKNRVAVPQGDQNHPRRARPAAFQPPDDLPRAPAGPGLEHLFGDGDEEPLPQGFAAPKFR